MPIHPRLQGGAFSAPTGKPRRTRRKNKIQDTLRYKYTIQNPVSINLKTIDCQLDSGTQNPAERQNEGPIERLYRNINVYFCNCGSSSTGNPPPERAFFIASTVVFSESKVTVAVWFSGSVSTFETPLISLRIVPTRAAVPAHLQPGTVNVTVFSAAPADCKAIRKNVANTITDKNFFFPIKPSLLSLDYS